MRSVCFWKPKSQFTCSDMVIKNFAFAEHFPWRQNNVIIFMHFMSIAFEITIVNMHWRNSIFKCHTRQLVIILFFFILKDIIIRWIKSKICYKVITCYCFLFNFYFKKYDKNSKTAFISLNIFLQLLNDFKWL